MNKSSILGALAFAPVVLIAGWLCWPKPVAPDVLTARKIQLVSPDGQRMVVISCENNAASVFLTCAEKGQMILLSSSDIGDQINLGGHRGKSSMIRLTTVADTSYGAEPRPSVKLMDRNGKTLHEVTADTTPPF